MNGEIGGFGIAYLADHDDIRVLANERPQRGCKCQSDRGLDLRLVHPRYFILDRIFNGQDFAGRFVQDRQDSRERCGLSASGRSSNDDHAVRQRQQSSDLGLVGWRKSQLFNHEQPAILRQDTYDSGFAVLRRHDRDTNVDIRAPGPQPRGAILRQPALRDVEAGDDLYAPDHSLRYDAGRRGDRPQQAVNAHTDRKPAMQRPEMNITPAQSDCFFKEIIDGADHRRTAGKIPQTLDVVFARLERFKAALNLDIPAAQTLIERNCDIFKRRHLNRDIRPEHDFGGAPRGILGGIPLPPPRAPRGPSTWRPL